MITTTIQPPAPRGPNPLAPLFLAGALAAGIMLLAPPPAQAADIIGFRIVVTACQGTDCRQMPLPPSFFEGLYACQGKAENLALPADLHGPAHFGLPEGAWDFKGRCVPVLGDRRA